MVMERDIPGMHVTLRRQEGITVADKLKGVYPPKFRSRGLFRRSEEIPQVFPQSVDLQFDNIPLLHLSQDKQHVLAAGDDGERLYLIRDDQVLFTESKENASKLEAVRVSGDISRIVFRAENPSGGGAIYVADPEGEVRTAVRYGEEGRLVTSSRRDGMPGWWADSISFAARDINATRLVITDGEGNAIREVQVPRSHAVEHITIQGTNDDFSKVVWKTYRSDDEIAQGANSYVYLNDQVLAENPAWHSIRCNDDLSRILIWTEEGTPARIYLNDQQIFPPESEEYGEIIETGHNKDLTVAAFAFYVTPQPEDNEDVHQTQGKELDQRKRVFYITPEGQGVYDETFEDVKRIDVKNQTILMRVIRNGVPWELTGIPPQELTSSQEPVEQAS